MTDVSDERRLNLLGHRLVAEGETLLSSPRRRVEFTGDGEADDLLNDLDHFPHAFVFACLVDRQVRAEWAWQVPNVVRHRLDGRFDMPFLVTLSEVDWVRLLREPKPAHRQPETMARVLHRATLRIVDHYDGNASRLWADRPSSNRLVGRFLAFHGAGQKIATMAANILVRDFHVPLADYRAIDISADVHVCRVMQRLGFIEPGAGIDATIYAAREINPDFPGVFDLVLWRLGRGLCRPTAPECGACPYADQCSYVR